MCGCGRYTGRRNSHLRRLALAARQRAARQPYMSLRGDKMTQNMTYERIAKCSYCRCTSLPVNDAGYCQRCNEGWYGFLNLPSATVGELEPERPAALWSPKTAGKEYEASL